MNSNLEIQQAVDLEVDRRFAAMVEHLDSQAVGKDAARDVSAVSRNLLKEVLLAGIKAA